MAFPIEGILCCMIIHVIHVLSYNNSFEWSFYPNFFVMNTLFFCKIQWQDKLMSFDSYEEYRDLYGCHKRCYKESSVV